MKQVLEGLGVGRMKNTEVSVALRKPFQVLEVGSRAASIVVSPELPAEEVKWKYSGMDVGDRAEIGIICTPI